MLQDEYDDFFFFFACLSTEELLIQNVLAQC